MKEEIIESRLFKARRKKKKVKEDKNARIIKKK